MSIFDMKRLLDEIEGSNLYCARVKKKFETEVKLREHDFEMIQKDYSQIVERAKEQFKTLESLRRIYLDVETSEENFFESARLKNLPQDIDPKKIRIEKIGSIAGGIGAGFGVGAGAVGLITAFGTAGTGTAISSLTGVFWVKATLAALGGGTLASGGAGMVGGALVLGGALFLPAIAVAGYFAHSKVKSAHKKAMQQKKAARQLEQESKAYFERVDNGIQLSRGINHEFHSANEFFQRLIMISLTSPEIGSDEEYQRLLQEAAQVVWNYGALKVLDENDKLNDKLDEELAAAKKSFDDCREHYIAFRVKVSPQILELAERLKKASPKSLKDEEIRELFDKAVESAESELDITAMKLNYVAREYIPRFRALLDRGVTIKIFYGIGEEDSTENHLTNDTADELRRTFRNYPNFKIKRTNTHAKIFICDEKFVMVSSYNVLSKQGKCYHFGEAGLYSEDADLISHHRKEYFNF